MNRIVFTLGVWLLPAACTALGAAGVFLLRRQARPATRRILCGMAAGIMLAASVWSLLLPAIARSQGRAAWVPPALGLILGAVGLLRLEDAAGQLLAGGPGHCGRMVLAVTLHNLPEGMVLIAPMLHAGIPPRRTLLLAMSTGVIEIVGTLLGFATVSLSAVILPFLLAFAGGAMLYIICDDMIPACQGSKSVCILLTGFCLMLAMDYYLG